MNNIKTINPKIAISPCTTSENSSSGKNAKKITRFFVFKSPDAGSSTIFKESYYINAVLLLYFV